MTSEDTSRRRWVLRLLFLGLVAVPVVTPWVRNAVGAVPSVGTVSPVRVVGFAVVALVAALFVRQKRRSRGQHAGESGGERSDRPSNREVEGPGEVYAPYAYNNQQQARRESKQIQERAEEIAEADREARKR